MAETQEMSEDQMSLVESLQVLHDLRSDEVVVTAMGAAREWMVLGSHPLDFNLVPSSMGQAPGLGMGIALAQPDRKVIVCNGDGSTLMNLGALVTITAAAPANLTLLIFDNGVYEITGAQLTPASTGSRSNGSRVNLVEMARASGFESVYEFADIESWRAQAERVIDEPGPTCAVLKVAAIPGAVGPKSPGPAPERAVAFAAALRE